MFRHIARLRSPLAVRSLARWSRSPPALAVSTSPARSLRYYSPALQPREPEAEEAEEPAWSAPQPSQDALESLLLTSAKAPAVPDGKSDLVPFDSLAGRVNHNTLKALTFRPFKLTAMSEVQKQVLSLMPDLIGGFALNARRSIPQNQHRSDEPPHKETYEDRAMMGTLADRPDLLVKAKTGTGKTIAFLVPAIDARLNQLNQAFMDGTGLANVEDGQMSEADQVNAQRAQGGRELRMATLNRVGALIISPTRELAVQIANEALKVHWHHKEFETRLLVGGKDRSEMVREFKRKRKDIVVATPGRLVDLLSEPAVRVAIEGTDMLILDEADTMLDMGFKKDLDTIMSYVPANAQKLMFSATVSPAIRKVAATHLKRNYKMIDCVPKNESNVHQHVSQYVTQLDKPSDQLPHLMRTIAHDQLVHGEASKMILFLPTTKLTMLYATIIRQLSTILPQHTAIHEIHSKLDSRQRARASEFFRKSNRPSILVTSDVSARGVDYPGITRVIQLGIPSTVDQYIHRIGRTGRGGQKNGRGDLILLPFERHFPSAMSQASIPFIPLSADDLATQMVQDRSNSADAEKTIKLLNKIPAAIKDLCAQLDPDAVNETFGTMLGYYLAKSSLLQATPNKIYASLQHWVTESMSMPRAPTLSVTFLRKIGVAQGAREEVGWETQRQRKTYWKPYDEPQREATPYWGANETLTRYGRAKQDPAAPDTTSPAGSSHERAVPAADGGVWWPKDADEAPGAPPAGADSTSPASDASVEDSGRGKLQRFGKPPSTPLKSNKYWDDKRGKYISQRTYHREEEKREKWMTRAKAEDERWKEREQRRAGITRPNTSDAELD